MVFTSSSVKLNFAIKCNSLALLRRERRERWRPEFQLSCG